MENVPEVIGKGNIENFQKWERKLSELGYQNYTEILNGRDYGIPQNRRRCFMVSILGDYAYEFPMRVALKYKLKNFLEKQADEKYYLSKSHIERISQWKAQQDPLKDIEKEKEVSPTLTARGAGNEIVEPNLKTKLCNKLVKEGKVKEGDVIRHSYSSNRLENGDKNLGRVENHEGLSPTLDTRCDCLGIVVNEENTKKYKNYITWRNKKGEFKEGQMATTTFPNGYGHGPRTHDESIALNTVDRPSVKQNLRIRKLTPKECIRLMGFEDEDYEAMRKVGMSDAAIYHMAGDSIIVTCLMAIFSTMINDDYKHIELINEYTKTLFEEK